MTPLAKRLPRELRRNIGKYLGIFLLMCGSIALTSGFLLAAHSIGCLIDDMRDAYAIEDGRVTTSFEATDDQLRAAEDATGDVGGVTLYKNFSIDAIIKKTAGDDGTKRTLRIACPAKGILDSPSTIVPSANSACKRTGASVEGSTRPRTAKTVLDAAKAPSTLPTT